MCIPMWFILFGVNCFVCYILFSACSFLVYKSVIDFCIGKIIANFSLNIWINTIVIFFQEFSSYIQIFNRYMTIHLVYFTWLEFYSFGFQEIGPLVLGKVVVKLLIIFPYYLLNDYRFYSVIVDIGSLCLHLFIPADSFKVLSIILIFWRTCGVSEKLYL